MKILRYITSALFAISATCIISAQDAPIAQDSIAILEEQEPQPFKRNLEQVSFVPKGQWITGVSVNYTQANNDNYQFFIVENLNGNSYSFKVSPMAMYAFKNDLALGGRFAYSRQMNKLESGSIKIDSESSYDVDNLYSLSHNYYGTAAFRNYLSMGKSKRFGFFNEVQLEIGGGQSKLCNGSGKDLTGTYEKNFSIGVGLSPGIVMFLNNYSAIEVNVGIVGFNYSHTTATTDQIYVSNRKSSYANFKLNLMSISFGVAFYL